MKHSMTVVFLTIISFGVFPTLSQTGSQVQEPFETYSHEISWKREKFYLDDFSIHLKQFPDTIGYIGFFVGDGDTLQKVRKRIDRAKRYLITKRKIDEQRIVVVYAGKLDNSRTAFYLIKKNSPPPDFAYREQ